MKMSPRLKIIASLVAVALASGFIGATLALWWQGRAAPSAAVASAPDTEANDLYVRHLKSYLNLTDEQTAKVLAISQRARADAMRDAGEFGALAQARRQMLVDIRAVLTSEQLPLFDRLDALRGRAFAGPPRPDERGDSVTAKPRR